MKAIDRMECRGWSKNLNQWVYGTLIFGINTHPMIVTVKNSFAYDQFKDGKYGLRCQTRCHEVIPDSVGQFIGRYDSTKFEDASYEETNRWVQEGNTKENWQGRKIYEGCRIEVYDWGNHPDKLLGMTTVIFDSDERAWRYDSELSTQDPYDQFRNVKIIDENYKE